MSWTEDRVATLKKLWGEGKTAAEIAKELGGVTRNAVIGKAHRLKLSNRASPIQQNKKTVAKTIKAPASSQNNEKPAPKIVPKAKDTSEVKAPPTLPTRKVTGRKTIVPLIDLKPNQCRWADGDPRDDDFGFCGAQCIPGLPYCSEHAQIAYQAATRNRILKSQAEDVSQKEIEMAKKVLAK